MAKIDSGNTDDRMSEEFTETSQKEGALRKPSSKERLPHDATNKGHHKSATTTFRGQHCAPCKDDGVQVPAEGFCVDCNDHLCIECFNIHKRARPLRNHVLKGQTKDSSSCHKPSQTLKGTECCLEHTNEPIEWYCDVHDQVCCDLCKQMDHRQCGELSTLSEASRYVLSTQVVNDKLVKLRDELLETKATLAINRCTTERCYDDFADSVTRHISAIRDSDLDRMKGLHVTCDAVMSNITCLLNDLDLHKQNQDTKRAFISMTRAKAKLALLDERLTSIKGENSIQKYRYVPEMTSSSENPTGILGRIVSTNGLLGEIKAKTPSDTSECYITGVDTLSNDRLVLADYKNHKIKLVDIKTKSVIAEEKLDMCPWDLAKIDDKRIAVTTYGNRKILLMLVTDTLTVFQTIDKNDFGYCYGMVCSGGDTLIVSFYKPEQIQVLSLTGRVIRYIENKDLHGTVRFGNIFYIAQIPGTDIIYLSDFYESKVIRMSLNSEILSSFTHEHLNRPCGITVGKNGRIFVCSYGSQKIYELTSDLSKGWVLLDGKNGIAYPYSICYDDVKDTLFVGSQYSSKLQMFLV